MVNQQNNIKDVFNVGTGNGLSVFDIINAFESANNLKINYEIGPRREGDVEKLIAETSKISRHIQWQPKYNDLEEIINSSIKF